MISGWSEILAGTPAIRCLSSSHHPRQSRPSAVKSIFTPQYEEASRHHGRKLLAHLHHRGDPPTMAPAGYEHLVPLDEVIISMNEVAHQIPRELRCTALGGLSTTPTSRQIAEKLAKGEPVCGCGKVSC